MEENHIASSASSASDQTSKSTAISTLNTADTLRTSANGTTLRFPTPEGSNLLAHLITSGSTSNINAMRSWDTLDESSSLADSAYELISSTDGESQDGREPDSLAASITSSFNIYHKTDDVLSLNGNEVTDNEEDDVEDEDEVDEDDEHRSTGSANLNQSSDYLPTQTRNSSTQSQLYNVGNNDAHAPGQSSPADSIRYAEQALCNPSTQSLSNFEYDSTSDDIQGRYSLLNRSIEFDERKEDRLHVGKISVTHTIREFSEGESVIVAANLGMAADYPRRMAVMVCQTMSQHYLLTREPLRVLYVGSDAAYSDIMHKISSAILASGSIPNSVSSVQENRRASTPGIYNIMPISSFDSARVPEIDEIQLMGVSDYYIKVDRCVRAEELGHKDGTLDDNKAYSIELESGRSHVSVHSSGGLTISPPWTPPHIAIFYVSGNDTGLAQKTRDAAWEFMARHAVPCIFISHSQSFSRSPSEGRWQNHIDQAAIHLCLESRDSSKPLALERLPIDLTSFLNIDARQMNRNLAYLTGLNYVSRKRQEEAVGALNEGRREPLIAAFSYTVRSFWHFAKGEDWRLEACKAATVVLNNLWRLFLSLLAMSAIGMVLSVGGPVLPRLKQMVLLHESSATSASYTTKPAAIGGYLYSTPTVANLPHITPLSHVSVPDDALSYTTKAAQAQPSKQISSQNRIISDKYSTDNANNRFGKSTLATNLKSTGCSIEVFSNHEILVKLPAVTKTKWLAKGAIDIDVWQGGVKLKSKLSTTDEGIIIELDREDAVGVMNVSIITARRPKLNETYVVDFGEPFATRFWDIGRKLWKDGFRPAIDAGTEAAAHARKIVSVCAETSHLYHFRSKPAQTVASGTSWLFNQTALSFISIKRDTKAQMHRLWSSPSVGETVQDLKLFFKERTPTLDIAERVSGDIRLAVLRAQIASKLWWLRAQGKTQECAAYEEKAVEHFRRTEGAIKAGGEDKHPEALVSVPGTAAPSQTAVWLW
ncbi:hypothetical protein SEPCBS119000_001179 [Sporothrix epigloea]|uniref:Uncharacterized protein n=1 Tax=Sporothrix epigloea TaxID=1892477 RepID=A0ABP0D9B0_9PEZI